MNLLLPEQMVQPQLRFAAVKTQFRPGCLMVQGTSSDAGKSLLVAALCRVFADAGFATAPFKPQNMALNSAVTACGGEIGRSTASQAQAARTAANVDMNPVLLKPSSDTGAQVIVQGKVIAQGKLEADAYLDYKRQAKTAVLQSFSRLSQSYQRVIIEGAGSPAEVNLRADDIANMGFAEAVDAPVILVADIDRGGVFAQLLGTLSLLSAAEQQRVVGFVINKFRGDIRLLQHGLTWLEQQSGRPVLGVLPYVHGLTLAEEDALNQQQQCLDKRIKVVVPVTPRMSNHNDFDLMRYHPQIDFEFCYAPAKLPACDLVVLAGSKNTRADLEFLRSHWQQDLARHLRYGGKVFGICGGMQMLGALIDDPDGVEGAPGSSQGLGYLPLHTQLQAQKTLTQVQGQFTLGGQTVAATGYEIHVGHSHALSGCQALFHDSNSDCPGYCSDDGQVAGSYWHGLFEQSAALELLVRWAGGSIQPSSDFASLQDNAFDQLAEVCRQSLDIQRLSQILAGGEVSA